MNQMTIKDALQIAIDAEIKAYNLYIDTREKITNAGTKAMLKELADMELGHRRLLENIVKKEQYTKLGENVPKESRGIADFLVAAELQQNATPQDAIIFAMKEEEKAFNFYDDMRNQFAGTELEKVFNKLASEELGHKRRLEAEYEAHIMWEN